MSIQRRGHLKEGLGYIAKPKKKNQKKKAKPAQAKKNNVVGGNATRGKATHDDFAGNANPHYVYIVIIMVMFMLSMLVLMMVMLLYLFGFQRPLLLTKEDPLRNGYLNQSLDSCRVCFRWVKMGA